MKFKRIIETGNGKSEWIQPVRRGYKMMCCDCSLVHNLDFRIVKRNSAGACFVQFRASRNARSTALARRKKPKA
jgi:hypothetical protein